MRITKSFVIATLATMMFTTGFVSCSSGEITDIYEGPNVQATKNPLSSLHPSSSFSWSTMDYATIKIEVDDQFNNEYDYIVHAYTVNPRTNNQALPILTGVARGNAPIKAAINLPSYSDKLYIEVINHLGESSVYSYHAPLANSNVTYLCSDEGIVLGSTRTTDAFSLTTTRADDETINGAYAAGYTINFEDQWPAFGDYDLNDVVLRVKSIETTQNRQNHVATAKFTFELLAVGATHTLGIGLQFDKILDANIHRITHSLEGMPGLRTTDPGAIHIHESGNLREYGQGNVLGIIPLAYDAHKLFLGVENLASRSPLNSSSSRTSGREFTLNLEFNSQHVLPEHFNISNLNFFIYRINDPLAGQDERIEIHMKGYAPTRHASQYYFNTGDDASSSNDYYSSVKNFPWAILVNDIPYRNEYMPWGWPNERTLVTNVYPTFADWVNGNGAEDWMMP